MKKVWIRVACTLGRSSTLFIVPRHYNRRYSSVIYCCVKGDSFTIEGPIIRQFGPASSRDACNVAITSFRCRTNASVPKTTYHATRQRYNVRLNEKGLQFYGSISCQRSSALINDPGHVPVAGLSPLARIPATLPCLSLGLTSFQASRNRARPESPERLLSAVISRAEESSIWSYWNPSISCR